MALITNAPRGTQDVLPKDSHKWHTIERILLDTAEAFGYHEIRFPTFEHTELFLRSVGDTTDVVQKEMYTFLDKGERSITLRPEGTAGTARAVLEHGLLNDILPLKVCYLTSCFRYEKPQAGRLREFHQFGVEMFGPAAPQADAELMALARAALMRLGVEGLTLKINSIGCPDCRADYHKALHDYFEAHKNDLCATCNDRLAKNPMRILDCKNKSCKVITADAPLITDYLCPDCKEHFSSVQSALTAMGIPFELDPTIVRGLDYYTRTVFELVSGLPGAQGTVCGGGRYDGLIEELGGNPTPGLGFAIGLERLLLFMEHVGAAFQSDRPCDLYLAGMGAEAAALVVKLAQRLREDGFYPEIDLMGRSLKAQMKYADKLGAKFSIVIGDNEIAAGEAKLKNMKTGEQQIIPLGDAFMEHFYTASLNDGFSEATSALENLLEGMDSNQLKGNENDAK